MTLQQLQRDNEQRYREIFAAAGLRRSHLIFPVFVSDRPGMIESMPGMTVTPIEKITQHVQTIVDSGILSLIVFGIPKSRDRIGSSAFDRKGVVQRAVRAIKSSFGSSVNVVTDICVCQYNLSGHCGIVASGNKRVDNDATLQILAQVAASHAEAGADVVAPSSMMDGQVRAIKSALVGFFTKTMILSYSAKHASSLYTPFRSAAFAKMKPRLDKSSYQVSYANPRQVLLEIETDISEGADIVMIKPALAYLDLVRMVKDRFCGHPVAVQNVSGEYAMIKAAAMHNLIDEEEWKVCSIASIKRAGADRIISYFALDVSKYL
ncbi:porphobilinogen synthase [Candidatus Nitrososphaera gargensis]|nr:porphobilinogen synthase [Candidatus Nitrososphaera gargensis]